MCIRDRDNTTPIYPGVDNSPSPGSKEHVPPVAGDNPPAWGGWSGWMWPYVQSEQVWHCPGESPGLAMYAAYGTGAVLSWYSYIGNGIYPRTGAASWCAHPAD